MGRFLTVLACAALLSGCDPVCLPGLAPDAAGDCHIVSCEDGCGLLAACGEAWVSMENVYSETPDGLSRDDIVIRECTHPGCHPRPACVPLWHPQALGGDWALRVVPLVTGMLALGAVALGRRRARRVTTPRS